MYKLVLIDFGEVGSVNDVQVESRWELVNALRDMKYMFPFEFEEVYKKIPKQRCHLYRDGELLLKDMELKTMCHVFDLLIPEINGGA